MLSFPHPPLIYGNNSVPSRFYGNRLTAYQAITSRYSTCILTLILLIHKEKSLTFKAFHYKFRSKVFTLFQATLHTQRFGLALSFRRFPSSFYESYPMGRSSTSTSLMPQLVQAVILPPHGAFAEINPPAVFSSTHSQVLGRV